MTADEQRVICNVICKKTKKVMLKEKKLCCLQKQRDQHIYTSIYLYLHIYIYIYIYIYIFIYFLKVLEVL